MRAAAHERRVRRVIAMDICTDFMEVALKSLAPSGLAVIAENPATLWPA